MIGIIDSGQKIITDGLVLHFDAAQLRSYPGSGTTWTNLSGNGINGTLTNGPAFNSQFGGGIVMDGVNDFVTYSMANPAAETVIVWMKSNTVNFNRDGYISSSRAANGHVIAPIVGTKTVIFYLTNFNNSSTISVRNWTLADITIPHFYCFTTNGSNSHIVYIDDSVILSANTAITRSATGVVTSNLGFDSLQLNRYGSANYYIVLRYNRALSATEILQNYNATKSRFGL